MYVSIWDLQYPYSPTTTSLAKNVRAKRTTFHCKVYMSVWTHTHTSAVLVRPLCNVHRRKLEKIYLTNGVTEKILSRKPAGLRSVCSLEVGLECSFLCAHLLALQSTCKHVVM